MFYILGLLGKEIVQKLFWHKCGLFPIEGGGGAESPVRRSVAEGMQKPSLRSSWQVVVGLSLWSLGPGGEFVSARLPGCSLLPFTLLLCLFLLNLKSDLFQTALHCWPTCIFETSFPWMPSLFLQQRTLNRRRLGCVCGGEGVLEWKSFRHWILPAINNSEVFLMPWYGRKVFWHQRHLNINFRGIGCYKQLTSILLVDLPWKVNVLKSGH